MAANGDHRDGRDARSDRTRAALVAAAVESLRVDGYAGASARRIAERAGCNQALVFYHFGSVTDLLLAALDDVSVARMSAYRLLLDGADGLGSLIDSAREVFRADLDAGHVAVLVEMITAAHANPALGAQVARRLTPWREFAREAVRKAVAGSPVASLVPADEAAHAIVAGILGLEMLADLDGDRDAALALFDRARPIAALLEMLTGGPR